MASAQNPVLAGAPSRWAATPGRQLEGLAARAPGGPLSSAATGPPGGGGKGAAGGGRRPAGGGAGGLPPGGYAALSAAAAAVATRPLGGAGGGAAGAAEERSTAQGEQIREAQREAGRRRAAGVGGSSPAASVREAQQAANLRRPADVARSIWSAQLKNAPASAALASQAETEAALMWTGGYSAGFQDLDFYMPYRQRGDAYGLEFPMFPGQMLQPQDFLGSWVDAQGNSVKVFSIDAWEVRLVAAMSRPRRADLQVCLRPSAAGGWVCGSFELDLVASGAEELVWYSPEGHVSIWTRGRA